VSMESASGAVGRTYRNSVGSVPDPHAIERIDEAIAAARRTLHPQYRNVVEGFVGPTHVIKSMEEFEVLRFMQAPNLTVDQKTAINSIRAAMGTITEGTRIAKVVPLGLAIGRVQAGDAELLGFYARVSDLTGASTTPQLIDRLRLDSPPYYHFSAGSPYAIIETDVNAVIASKTRIPRNGGYSNGSPDEYVENLEFPNTGNAFAASRDGRLVPELTTSSATMTAGVGGGGQAVTTMRFRFPDGTPYPQTIGTATASEWTLIPDVSSPTGFAWVPLP
jgi:hypothetical protein